MLMASISQTLKEKKKNPDKSQFQADKFLHYILKRQHIVLVRLKSNS